MTTLLQAIQSLNIPALINLIEEKIELNQPCSNGQLPLVIAITQLFDSKNVDLDKKFQVITILFNASANINLFTIDNNTLWHYLCCQGYLLAFKLAEMFLDSKKANNINVLNTDGKTPILVALEHANFNFAKLLLKHGADATIPDTLDNTTLHLAASNDDTNFIAELLKQKIDVILKISWEENH